jgi:hypothetical protein
MTFQFCGLFSRFQLPKLKKIIRTTIPQWSSVYPFRSYENSNLRNLDLLTYYKMLLTTV